jgi:hypothetical protein
MCVATGLRLAGYQDPRGHLPDDSRLMSLSRAALLLVMVASGCDAQLTAPHPESDLSVAGDLADLAIANDLAPADRTGFVPWTPVAGTSGVAVSIAISPNDGSTPFNIFVGTQGDGVFHSSDGTNWMSAGPATVARLASFPIAAVSWAALPDGTVQLTTNGGASWTQTSANPPIAIASWVVVAGVGPFGGGTASTGEAIVVKAKMMGVSWTSSAPFGNGAVRGLAYGTGAGGAIVLAAVSGSSGGVFVSNDGGATFASTSLPESDVLSVATAPSSPSTAVAGTNGLGAGVYLSANGAASWTPGGAGLGNTVVRALAIDPTNPQIVYAGTQSGVWRSSDGGATFSLSGLASIAISELAIQNGSPSTVYAATANGLFVTTTGGQ